MIHLYSVESMLDTEYFYNTKILPS